MTDSEFQTELAALFERDDKVFRADGDAFAAGIERKLRQRMWMRRAVLAGAMLCGGLFAGLNAPDMLGQFEQFIASGEALIKEAQNGDTGIPVRTRVLVFAALLSTLAVFSTERI